MADSVKKRRTPEELRAAWNGARGENTDLFVYGTMMSSRHVKLLLNRDVESEPCTLHNYLKIVPPGAFFFIVRQHGTMVRGRLLKDLSPEEIARLDAFENEGTLYYRVPVIVRNSEGFRRRCQTYVGNVPALQHSFAKEIHFEDRYSQYIERKIEQVLEEEIPPETPAADSQLARQALQELMSLETDSLLESHFDGDYICNYIMSQTFRETRPPQLGKLFENPAIRPYADHYMEFICRHIIFNQVASLVRKDFPDAVRVSRKYFRHGISILLSLMYCNRFKERIIQQLKDRALDLAVPGRSYREYAEGSILAARKIYDKSIMRAMVSFLESNWYSTPTPLGAELEFSPLGVRAVYAEAGEDPAFDGFYWFNDFDLQRRLWRLGGHIDAHRTITMGGQTRYRGFLEYALGRFNIGADLSRPLFDCPWAMSMVINEAVKFCGIPPHSLHISMEMPRRSGRTIITENRHSESDLVCLLLLGGDLHHDEEGNLREWRIFNNELDTNSRNSLNFLDRKYHYSRANDEDSGSDVMEYKYLRLHNGNMDYARVIAALKGYQFASCGRPITITRPGQPELPEQTFMREWAENPQSLADNEINSFIAKVEQGIKLEFNTVSLDKRNRKLLENIYSTLKERNKFVAKG